MIREESVKWDIKNYKIDNRKNVKGDKQWLFQKLKKRVFWQH